MVSVITVRLIANGGDRHEGVETDFSNAEQAGETGCAPGRVDDESRGGTKAGSPAFFKLKEPAGFRAFGPVKTRGDVVFGASRPGLKSESLVESIAVNAPTLLFSGIDKLIYLEFIVSPGHRTVAGRVVLIVKKRLPGTDRFEEATDVRLKRLASAWLGMGSVVEYRDTRGGLAVTE
ncbi:MAG: hypothetical protein ACI8QF_002848 [Limisphaerales bacterium]|jgi:hypothetical protein